MPRKSFHAWSEAEAASDQELAQGLAAGAPGAFEAIYYRYAGLAYYVALRWLDAEGARQVVEDVFVGLPEMIHRCPPNTSLGGWIWDLADRSAYLSRTAAQRRSPAPTPAHQASRGAEIAALRQLIDRLPYSLQAVLRANARGAGAADAARVLGLPTPTTLARLMEARARLEQEWHNHKVSDSAAEGLPPEG
jgi:DNA-directed RNA polymerase specialized sigma24 family protein